MEYSAEDREKQVAEWVRLGDPVLCEVCQARYSPDDLHAEHCAYIHAIGNSHTGVHVCAGCIQRLAVCMGAK